MFKVKLGIAPSFMNDIFQKRLVSKESVVCTLRSQSEFYNYNNPRTVLYTTETIRFQKYGKFCRTVSKRPANLKVFKETVKKWIPTKYKAALIIFGNVYFHPSE